MIYLSSLRKNWSPYRRNLSINRIKYLQIRSERQELSANSDCYRSLKSKKAEVEVMASLLLSLTGFQKMHCVPALVLDENFHLVQTEHSGLACLSTNTVEMSVALKKSVVSSHLVLAEVSLLKNAKRFLIGCHCALSPQKRWVRKAGLGGCS